MITFNGKCPIKCTDCEAIATIKSEYCDTLLCVGENDGSTRVNKQDKYRHCVKMVDHPVEQQDCDKRDLAHQVAVITAALAAIEEKDGENER